MSLRDNLSKLSPNEFLEKMQDLMNMYIEEATSPNIASMKNLNSLVNNYLPKVYSYFFAALCTYFFVCRLNIPRSKTIAKIHKILPELTNLFKQYTDEDKSNPGALKAKIKYAKKIGVDAWGTKFEKYESYDAWVKLLASVYAKNIPDIDTLNTVHSRKKIGVDEKGKNIYEYHGRNRALIDNDFDYIITQTLNQKGELVLPPSENSLWIEYIKSIFNWFSVRGPIRRIYFLEKAFRQLMSVEFFSNTVPDTKEEITSGFERFYKKVSETDLDKLYDKFLTQFKEGLEKSKEVMKK